MTNETNNMRQIWMALSARGDRLWRNNVGTAWQGEKVGAATEGGVLAWLKKRLPARAKKIARVKVLINPRRVKFGLFEGSGDLIGLRSVLITPEMVGRRIAQFMSVEAKAEGATTKKEHLERQKAWATAIRHLGGIGVIAESVEDVPAAGDLVLTPAEQCCVDLYMGLHVSQLRDCNGPVTAAWEEGKRIREGVMQIGPELPDT